MRSGTIVGRRVESHQDELTPTQPRRTRKANRSRKHETRPGDPSGPSRWGWTAGPRPAPRRVGTPGGAEKAGGRTHPTGHPVSPPDY